MTTKWRGIFKIQEETGELNQILGKLGAYPGGEYADGKDLLVPLEDELADVMAAVLYFAETNNLRISETRVKEKLSLFRHWQLSGIN